MVGGGWCEMESGLGQRMLFLSGSVATWLRESDAMVFHDKSRM